MLEVKDGLCTLFSDEGKVVCKSKLSFKGALENGVCLVVGGTEVEIDEPLSPDAFAKGTCFIKAAAPVQATTHHPSTGFKRVKPLGAVASTPSLRPMHDPTAPDALICNQPQLVERLATHGFDILLLATGQQPEGGGGGG